jgi:hypothetical protein
MTDVNDILMGGGGAPTAKFPTIGITYKGTIVESAVSQQTDIDGNLKVWNDGNPMMQAVITIQTDERDPAIDDDDGKRRLFVKGQMQHAIREAVKAAGCKGIAHGGTLAVQYSGNGTPSKPGLSAPKQYTAAYKPPEPTADANALLGTDTPAAPVQTQQAAPTPQPASALL